MFTKSHAAMVLAALAGPGLTDRPAQAQVLYARGIPYTQTFDILAASGSGVTFTNNVTLLGWYASRPTYTADDGSSISAAMKSFGASGSGDRALGSIANSSLSPIRCGVRLQNASGSDITQFTLTYTGEEWRGGGGSAAQKLTFSYGVFSSGTGTLTAPSYNSVSALDFTTPVTNKGNVALDGNDPADRVTMSATVSGLTWADGSDLWLTWSDTDDPGNDAGLALDDLSLTTPSAAPEPAVGVTFLIGSGTLGLIACRRPADRRRDSI